MAFTISLHLNLILHFLIMYLQNCIFKYFTSHLTHSLRNPSETFSFSFNLFGNFFSETSVPFHSQNWFLNKLCLRFACLLGEVLFAFAQRTSLKLSSLRSLRFRLRSSPRPISNSQLHALLHFHPCPIYLVVFKGSYFFRMGSLILRPASRLDAFSVYPLLTWLLCHASGQTTDPPAVSPSRSSRTKDSSSQTSYAHAG